jgi:hypothetical protein
MRVGVTEGGLREGFSESDVLSGLSKHGIFDQNLPLFLMKQDRLQSQNQVCMRTVNHIKQ